MTVPLIGRLLLPHPQLWAIVPFGVLPVVLADRGGSRKDRARRCLVGLAAAAVGALVGGVASYGAWTTALTLVGIAALSGAVSWLGQLASVAALDLLVFACIASGRSLSGPAWKPPLLIAAGGVGTLLVLLTGEVVQDVSWRHGRPDARRMVGAAVRLAACMAVAEAIANVRGVERGYWIALTVAIVLRPELGDVFVRAIERGLGTVVGAAVGALILIAVGNHWGALPFIAVLAALSPIALRRNFMLFAGMISALVVLLVAGAFGHGSQIALDRIIDTLIGCAIVLLVGHVLWLRAARLFPRPVAAVEA
jgi:hypothetical protein